MSAMQEQTPEVRQPRRLAWVLGGAFLIVCVLLVGVGSAFAANRLSGTSATGAPRTVAINYRSAAAQDLLPSRPAVVQPTPTPPSCNCAGSTSTEQRYPWSPSAMGQEIVVSLSQQAMYVYQDKKLLWRFLVETGRPELPTPTGTFNILAKTSPDLFTSPWPEGSPNWYYPTKINYAMRFLWSGFFLHDAWWHEAFGPGANLPHIRSDGQWETGSHGCVGMRVEDARTLYNWVYVGAVVRIIP